MIAISFSPIYEDRVSMFLKHSNFTKMGIDFSFEEEPGNLSKDRCYWLIKPKLNKHINYIFSLLREMKNIMGVEDLEFCYCSSMKEYFNQYNPLCGSINWFRI